MNTMPKTYDFASAEARLYDWWERNGWFKPECRPETAEPFTISIPPPNVTGELHMGHAMFVSVEDLMVRRARMQGRAALWLPGTDHAGIATQLLVERELLRTLEMTRAEIGREKFLEYTWAWKEKYGGRIIEQMRALGASCDWERTRFTLDAGLSRAVVEAFVRLHRMGLIYRGEYLVNWSPGLQTAVSDLEVEYGEEPGWLYYFKYPVENGEFIPVATTRPETILGDTAVAVHPDDERYRGLIGRTAFVPILNRPIPIIGDPYVEMGFGTGALKITPGHDANDFEIGRRHNLPILNVMNKDATLNELAGPYAGLDRFVCRERLWADMEAAGLTIRTEPYVLNVPRSQRGGEIVEPLVSRQWFVKMDAMAALGLEAVRSGRVRIVPERFTKTWENWLTNIRPWCISRQLWWGHRIPVYYVDGDESRYVVAHDEAEAYALARARYGPHISLTQDPDVLDTWFSSGLWPFSTLGWPDETADLRRFYPTTVMETGYDILFFWVARMVMQGLLFTNDIPFEVVYLHGLVRDEEGRKMSKTLGNVVDPLLVTAQYGVDALRFTLLTGGTPGNDMNLSIARVENNRNFANKLWNTARFTATNLDKATAADRPDVPAYTAADHWILTRLSETTANANRLMDNYLYGEAGRQIYDFLWSEFADWYIEAAKVQLAAGGARAWTTLSVLLRVLDDGLRLLHPYIPFVTEETWQQLKQAFATADLGIAPAEGWPEALIIAAWPQAEPVSAAAAETAAEFDRLRELIRAVRAARNEHKAPPGRPLPASIAAGPRLAFAQSQRELLCTLARLDDARLVLGETVTAPDQALTLSLGDYTVYLPLAGLVDLEKERARLEKETADLDRQIARLSGLLGGDFVHKAPAAVVQKERDKLVLLEASRAELQDRLAVLTEE